METSEHYKKLHFQMNLFYRDTTQDVCTLKPTSLEEGRVSRRQKHCRSCVGRGDRVRRFVCAFLSGVCGVLGGKEVVVSGRGGVDLRGLGFLSSLLLSGRPRRASRRPLRAVRPEQLGKNCFHLVSHTQQSGQNSVHNISLGFMQEHFQPVILNLLGLQLDFAAPLKLVRFKCFRIKYKVSGEI